MNGPLIMKFGGTSVADDTRLASAIRLAKIERDRGQRMLVVLSAMAGCTDSLTRAGEAATAGSANIAHSELASIAEGHNATAARLLNPAQLKDYLCFLREEIDQAQAICRGASLLGDLPSKSWDRLLAVGELLSSRLFALAADCAWFDARTVLKTDSRHRQARPDLHATKTACAVNLKPLLDARCIVVTQGFIGSDRNGTTTTLGRGGSDYSASLFGYALGANEIQIWTDVQGVQNADPRVVAETEPVGFLSYDEAAELAAFGAKVLHPATMSPAVEAGIPISVRDSQKPDGSYTLIGNSPSGRTVCALASRKNVSVLTATTPRMLGGIGFLASIFDAFKRHGVSADCVATSEVSVSASVDSWTEESLAALVQDISSIAQVRLDRNLSLVAVVGHRLPESPEVVSRAFTALAGIQVRMISLGFSQSNLSFVVDEKQGAEAQRRLHREFFGNERSLCPEEKELAVAEGVS